MPNGQPLGVEQWGKILGDTVNLKIITFPVPFNESFGGVALFNGDPVAVAEYATITDVTNTNFKIYMYANNAGTGYANANIFYLFLGAQQQWGFTADSMSILFPMAFSSTSYILLSDIQVTSGGNILAAYIYQNTKTISGANFAYSYRRNWIAIGC